MTTDCARYKAVYKRIFELDIRFEGPGILKELKHEQNVRIDPIIDLVMSAYSIISSMIILGTYSSFALCNLILRFACYTVQPVSHCIISH